jgi:hypothetical protein
MLAVIDDPTNAPTPDFDFQEGEVMRDLGQHEYLDYFNAVPWSWRVERQQTAEPAAAAARGGTSAPPGV